MNQVLLRLPRKEERGKRIESWKVGIICLKHFQKNGDFVPICVKYAMEQHILDTNAGKQLS